MTEIYIVRSGTGAYEPESYILGLYPTLELAKKRISEVSSEEYGFDTDETWIDIVDVGADGADCFLSNR